MERFQLYAYAGFFLLGKSYGSGFYTGKTGRHLFTRCSMVILLGLDARPVGKHVQLQYQNEECHVNSVTFEGCHVNSVNQIQCSFRLGCYSGRCCAGLLTVNRSQSGTYAGCHVNSDNANPHEPWAVCAAQGEADHTPSCMHSVG